MLQKSLRVKGTIMRAKLDLEFTSLYEEVQYLHAELCWYKILMFQFFFLGIKVLKNQEITNVEVFSTSTDIFILKVCKIHDLNYWKALFNFSPRFSHFQCLGGVSRGKSILSEKNFIAVLPLPNNFLMNHLLFCGSHTSNSSGREILVISSLDENGSQYIPSGSEGKVVFWFVNCQKLSHFRQLRKINYTDFCTSQPEIK